MRPRFPSAVDRTICIARSTSTAKSVGFAAACGSRHGGRAGSSSARRSLQTDFDGRPDGEPRWQCREPSGVALAGDEDPRWKSVLVRCCRYLNNVVEQDHRAIKRRCASMLGLKSFETAAITFAGIELAHRIRKQQFSFGQNDQCANWSLKQYWDRALAQSPNDDRVRGGIPPARPLMHQNSRVTLRSETLHGDIAPLRYARKIFDGRGLYLLGDAERRPLLALQLSLRREAQDARVGRLS